MHALLAIYLIILSPSTTSCTCCTLIKTFEPKIRYKKGRTSHLEKYKWNWKKKIMFHLIQFNAACDENWMLFLNFVKCWTSCRMYQDKLAHLKKQLQQLEEGTLPEYIKKRKKIDQQYKERIRVNEIWREFEVKLLFDSISLLDLICI